MTFSLADTTKLKDPNLGVNWAVQPLNLVSKVKLKLEVSWTLSKAFGQLLRLLGFGAVSRSFFFESRLSEVVGIGGSWLESGISDGFVDGSEEGCESVGVWSVLVLVLVLALLSAIWGSHGCVCGVRNQKKKGLFLGLSFIVASMKLPKTPPYYMDAS